KEKEVTPDTENNTNTPNEGKETPSSYKPGEKTKGTSKTKGTKTSTKTYVAVFSAMASIALIGALILVLVQKRKSL
ncbi:hypothetical protein, partial [Faecalicoccus pleomorphus]